MPDPKHLSWDNDPIRLAWSSELLTAITRSKSDLERGEPESFIDGYTKLEPDLQLKFWAEFVIGIAKFESNWKPDAIFHEPPPLGVDSVGLLQLSYSDQKHYHLEPLDPSAKSLEDPLINIRCGVVILTKLISADRTVAGSSNGGLFKGAARYWSVIRGGPKHHLSEIRSQVAKAVGL
jgi:Transglycosylase SLT domain